MVPAFLGVMAERSNIVRGPWPFFSIAGALILAGAAAGSASPKSS
jgi:hypothetical protein